MKKYAPLCPRKRESAACYFTPESGIIAAMRLLYVMRGAIRLTAPALMRHDTNPLCGCGIINDTICTSAAALCARQKEEPALDVRVGDILQMKKNHPCGGSRFLVLRSGMDFKLRCETCGHEVMVPRVKAEKNIKRILRPEEDAGAGAGK